ncbi:MAG: extracellular solute-binding protein, partial [bacterium]|nr:extracellular solute-binding protein [bacterium]
MKKRNLLCLLLAALLIAACLPAAAETATEYPEKLRIWTAWYSDKFSSIGMKDYNDCWAWQELSRKTGTTFEFEYGASGNDGQTNLNLLIASKNLPDIIAYDWKNIAGGAEVWAEDGVIVDLTDMMDVNLKDYKAAMEAVDSLGLIKSAGGRYYYLAQPYDKLGGGVYQGLIIRQDMLDELGEQAPTTIEEHHALLRKAKEHYGESFYPQTGTTFAGACGIGPLMWAFGTHYGFYLEGDKVVYGPMSEQFTEAMEYIHTLYEEGLIDPDYATQDRTAEKGKMMADLSLMTFEFQPAAMMEAMATQNPTFKLVGITDLKKDADSKPYSFNSAYISSMQYGSSCAITTACAEPEKAANFLNYIFTDEGYMITNYGEKDVDYTIDADGSIQWTDAFKALKSEAKEHTRNFGTAAVFPFRCSLDAYWSTLPQVSVDAIKHW